MSPWVEASKFRSSRVSWVGLLKFRVSWVGILKFRVSLVGILKFRVSMVFWGGNFRI